MGYGEDCVNAAVAGNCTEALVKLTHEVVTAEVRVNHASADFSYICRTNVETELFCFLGKFMFIKEKGTGGNKFVIVIKCT